MMELLLEQKAKIKHSTQENRLYLDARATIWRAFQHLACN